MNTITAITEFVSVAGPAALLTLPVVVLLNRTHAKAKDATGGRHPALPGHAFGDPHRW